MLACVYVCMGIHEVGQNGRAVCWDMQTAAVLATCDVHGTLIKHTLARRNDMCIEVRIHIESSVLALALCCLSDPTACFTAPHTRVESSSGTTSLRSGPRASSLSAASAAAAGRPVHSGAASPQPAVHNLPSRAVMVQAGADHTPVLAVGTPHGLYHFKPAIS